MIDRTLIEECRSGNLQKFGELVEMTSPFAFSVAFRMLGDEEQAKDAVQETMIRIWQKMNRIKSPDSYKMWIYKIVLNECYDRLRKRKRKLEIRADEQMWAMISNHTSSDQVSEIDYREAARIIDLLTNKLSPAQKTVFVLGDLEEMSNEEISSVTGMSKKNVKANLYHARKRMNELIKKHI